MHRNNMFVFVTFHILMIFPKSRFRPETKATQHLGQDRVYVGVLIIDQVKSYSTLKFWRGME
jgi:hypothetical protein